MDTNSSSENISEALVSPISSSAQMPLLTHVPFSWETLLTYDRNPPEKALPRKQSVQKRYGGYLGVLKKRGTNIEQDVMSRIINNHTNDRFILSKNDFPYNVEEDVLHLVLWVNPLFARPDEDTRDEYDAPADNARNEQKTEEDARDYIESFINSTDATPAIAMFENIKNNRSVSDVRHFQLFVKKEIADALPIKKL